MVAVSEGCDYMGCTRGSGFVSTADNVLEMSVAGVGCSVEVEGGGGWVVVLSCSRVGEGGVVLCLCVL